MFSKSRDEGASTVEKKILSSSLYASATESWINGILIEGELTCMLK